MQIVERFYRAILDSIPLPVFLVDERLRVYELNETAVQLFGVNTRTKLIRRTGDALHCLYASGEENVCGKAEHCRDCVVRSSVLSSLASQGAYRQRTRLRLLEDGVYKDRDYLVTAKALPPGQGRLSLLIFEDVTELTLLKNIIPICMHCKKVRDDQQYWRHVEAYFHNSIGVDFSHGVCPECMRKHYPETGT